MLEKSLRETNNKLLVKSQHIRLVMEMPLLGCCLSTCMCVYASSRNQWCGPQKQNHKRFPLCNMLVCDHRVEVDQVQIWVGCMRFPYQMVGNHAIA